MPGKVKLHRSYTVAELADCLSVHKNSVRGWQSRGLVPIDATRPLLFQGGDVRRFLERERSARKRPCPVGTLYCFRCRDHGRPALGMAYFVIGPGPSGNIRALCDTCETMMHRRARRDALPSILPGCDVQFVEAAPRLMGRDAPT